MKNVNLNRFFKTTGLVAAALVVMVSCKKEDESVATPGNNTPAPTKTQLLTAKNWKMSAATVSPAYQGHSDMYSMFSDCEKDNILKFGADNKATIDEGAKKCDMMDPQTSTTTWALGNNEADITIGSNTYKLVSVDASTLKISHSMAMDGTNYTMTETYSAQ